MAKFRVTHEDGRSTDVFAPDEAGAKKQANHQETTRAIIDGRRGLPSRIDPSLAISVVKIKE